MSASSFLSRPPPRFSKRLQPDPRTPTGRPSAHGPVNQYSAGGGWKKTPEGISRMAAAQLPAIPTPAASLFPPPRSQSAGRQPNGGSRRPGQAPSASPTPQPAHPGRPPALSLPSPAPPRPRCRRTLQSHRAQVPLPSTPPASTAAAAKRHCRCRAALTPPHPCARPRSAPLLAARRQRGGAGNESPAAIGLKGRSPRARPHPRNRCSADGG